MNILEIKLFLILNTLLK